MLTEQMRQGQRVPQLVDRFHEMGHSPDSTPPPRAHSPSPHDNTAGDNDAQAPVNK